MQFKLTLALPRDECTVPVVRRILHQSLLVLGVEDEVVADIELALTEACTNVLDHAHDAQEYEVSAGIDGEMCVIEVVDRGAGFNADLKGLADAEADAEDGRGIQLMRALVDSVTFVNKPTDGTLVHLQKQLVWKEDSVIKKLTLDRPATVRGPWSADEGMKQAPAPL